MIQIQERIQNYFERNPKLHVLFVFDVMGIIKQDLMSIEWNDDYIYKEFDGAWFNTKYNIENTWKEKRVILLFSNITYPHSEEQQLRFPLMDMLRANMEYKEDDYEALMQQHNLPDKFRPFIKRNIQLMSSSKLTTMLEPYMTPEAFSEDVVCRAMISSYLGEKKVVDWDEIVVRMFILDLEEEERKRIDFYKRLSTNSDANKAVNDHLNKLFGLTYTSSVSRMKSVASCLKYNCITQSLTAATADSYKAYKITELPRLNAINRLYEYGINNRTLSDKFKKAISTLASEIKEQEIINVYGIDAPYYQLTESLCWPILNEMLENKLQSAPDETDDRMRELSLKFNPDSHIQIVFSFIENVALYYSKVNAIGSLRLNTPEAYVQLYLDKFYELDMHYRKSLEYYHEAKTKDLPVSQKLSETKQRLDQDYAKLTNMLNLEWLTCVKEKGNYFDGLSLPKQEDFFVNSYNSSANAPKQAVIISDALRYEVAQELMHELAKEKNIAKLSAYRAMLPTETKYCKPSLLPHSTLKLQGDNMEVDGKVLSGLDARTVQLTKFVEKACCVNFATIISSSRNDNRELFKRQMVYIFHDTIDEAGHSQNPLSVVSACKAAVKELANLVTTLHASLNVTDVFITSDHGFLYNDMLFEEKDKHRIDEPCIEKKSRYYLTTDTAEQTGILKMPLNRVSGMTSLNPTYVAVPVGTNRLAAQGGGYSFTHGGASLQEMIIPVIRSSQKRIEKTEKVGVSLMTHNLSMVSSRLVFKLIQSDAVSMTMLPRTVVCCIYNGDDPVTDIKTIPLDSADANNLNNRVTDISMTLNKAVSASLLQLRIWDKDDPLNPLLKENVTNNTFIEQDF